MEFTQLHFGRNSPPQTSVNSNCQTSLTSHIITQPTPDDYHSILNEIECIIRNRQHPLFVVDHEDQEVGQCFMNRHLKNIHQPETVETIKRRSSNNETVFHCLANRSEGLLKREKKNVRIFYFQLDEFKDIQCSFNGTINEVIEHLLEIYVKEGGFLKSVNPQDYELRPIGEGDVGFQAVGLQAVDFQAVDFQAVGLQAVGFQAVGLQNNQSLKIVSSYGNQPMKTATVNPEVNSPMRTDNSPNKTNKKQSFLLTLKVPKISPSKKQNPQKITILNSKSIKLAQINIQANEKVSKIHDYLQKQLKINKIILTENLDDGNIVPQDFEIKNLNSFVLYIKEKQFEDDEQKSMISEQKQEIEREIEIQNLPIGIAEASRYEQFEMIKINKWGFRQKRILGVDQEKIYNYDPDVKERRDSILSIFFGNDYESGTKRPHRMLSDLKSVKRGENAKIELKFSDKTICFIASSNEEKERFVRKVKFLVDFHAKNK